MELFWTNREPQRKKGIFILRQVKITAVQVHKSDTIMIEKGETGENP